MKTVNVRARVTYDYQVEIPEDENGCAANDKLKVDLESYCDCFDPVYYSICKLMVASGVQWERGISLSIIDKDTNKVLWDGE